jgi:hypothetical protein
MSEEPGTMTTTYRDDSERRRGPARKLQCEPGQRFGKLTVVKVNIHNTGENRKALVRCDCGTERVVFIKNMCYGQTLSCGCGRRDPWELLSEARAQVVQLESRLREAQAQIAKLTGAVAVAEARRAKRRNGL